MASSEPVRALFFSPTLGGGGAEKQVLRLLSHLDRSVIIPSLSLCRAGGAYEAMLPSDVSVHHCCQSIRSSSLSALVSVPRLRAHIVQAEPEVVVSVLPHANAVVTAACATLRSPPAIVLGAQNNLTAGLEQMPRAVRGLVRSLYLRAYRGADQIVALSQGVARELGNQLPGSRPPLHIVYNAGADQSVVQGSRATVQGGVPSHLVVACGRLHAQKDYPTLLRALAKCQIEPAPSLWIVGEGPLRAELERLVSQLGLSTRVRFVGFVDNPYQYMAAAKVFALSSRWEGFANVIVEALACGTPVVSTDCPYGPGEIVQGTSVGRLVPVGDSESLARALDETLAAGKSRDLTEACRQRAEAFGVEASCAGYASVLRQACLRTGPGPTAHGAGRGSKRTTARTPSRRTT